MDGCPGYQYTAWAIDLTSRNGGWSREGMLIFNEMYQMVQINRNNDKGAFSDLYKEHWLEKTTRKRKRRRDNNGSHQALKISDDMEEYVLSLLDSNVSGTGKEGGSGDSPIVSV